MTDGCCHGRHLLIDTDDINTGAKVYRGGHPYLSF